MAAFMIHMETMSMLLFPYFRLHGLNEFIKMIFHYIIIGSLFEKIYFLYKALEEITHNNWLPQKGQNNTGCPYQLIYHTVSHEAQRKFIMIPAAHLSSSLCGIGMLFSISASTDSISSSKYSKSCVVSRISLTLFIRNNRRSRKLLIEIPPQSKVYRR